MKNDMEEVDKVILEDEFIILHKADTIHFMEKSHYHNGFEIHFTLTNATTYLVDGKEYIVDSGSIGLFSPDKMHRVSIDRNKLYERYIILFKPSLIEKYSSDYINLLDLYTRADCLQLNNTDKTKMIRLYKELLEANENKEMNELYIKIKVIEILLMIDGLIGHDFNKTTNNNKYKILPDIVSYIKNSYMEKITLEDLCEEFFISKSTLIRMFKICLGMTPNQYIIHTRILNSRDLLEKGYSVKEVSVLIGYKNESNFIKKFKEIHGESPKRYSLNMMNRYEQ